MALRQRFRSAWNGLTGRERSIIPDGYRGGQRTRQTDGWFPQGLGPNLLADMTLDLAKRRLRDAIDNNPVISGAQSGMRRNVVGKGIHPEPDTGFEDLDNTLKVEWELFARGVDPERKFSIVDSQAQAFNELFGGGEVLNYFRFAGAFNGFPAAPAVELVDCERMQLLQSGLFTNIRVANGNYVRQGVEFDAEGRAIAYHVLKEHPRDNFLGGMGMMEFIRLPATDAIHAFIPRRLRQVRGVPWAVSTIETINMEAGFNEAYLLLARIAACVSVWLSGATDENLMAPDGKTPMPMSNAADGSFIKRLVPGLIGLLRKGVEPKILSSNIPPPTFASTTEIMQRRLAAGLNMSYAVVARDFSKATFSATRAEQLEDRKEYEPLQGWIVHFHTRPLYRRFVAWAITSGRVTLTPEQLQVWITNPEQIYGAMWLYPGWKWVNPLQEATATQVELATGITDFITVCGEQGRDWRQVLERQYRVELYDARRRKEVGLPPTARSGIVLHITPSPDDGGPPSNNNAEDKDKVP